MERYTYEEAKEIALNELKKELIEKQKTTSSKFIGDINKRFSNYDVRKWLKENGFTSLRKQIDGIRKFWYYK